jgi:hypothetical protein
VLGVLVPIPSLPLVLSQKSHPDCVSHPDAEANTSCPSVNPVIIHPVSVPIPTLFPARTNPLLKEKRSENCPVRLLYVIHPVAERLVRLILLLKVFQSATERAPVVVELAVAIPKTPVRLL